MTKAIACSLEYNKAVEFVTSILKYSTYKQRQDSWNTLEVDRDIIKKFGLSPNSQVIKWLEYVDQRISPFLKNDLFFINNEAFKIIDVLLHLVILEDLKDPLELIDAFKLIDTNTMIEISYKFYELDVPLDDEEALRQSLTMNFSKETANAFLQYKNNPEDFRDKVASVISHFYEEFYSPYEEEVYQLMDNRLDFLSKLFDEDPIYFINTVGIGDYSKAIDLHREMKLYLSFFLDVGIFFFSHNQTLYMYCGQSVEHRFEDREKQDTYKALFKALSDDKRIEILQLTSKRPWYNKELADHFKLSTATLSYHLNLLLDLGILNFEPSIINNRYYYTANREHINNLFQYALEDILG